MLRNRSLDVLRGIAVLMVIVDHYSVPLKSDSHFLESFGRGVDLFFVLSGFLISGLLFAEWKENGKLDVKLFWIRRGFKIYPAFYLFLIAGARWMPGTAFVHEALFLQGYSSHFWFHTWSLAVEEHFYFALPVLLWLMVALSPKKSSNPFRLVPLISIALSIGCFYLRLQEVERGRAFGIATHLRIDALFAGVALGYFWHFDRESFKEGGAKWVLVVGLVMALMLPFMPSLLEMVFAYLASLFVLAWTVNQSQSKGRTGRMVAFIGRHSYSIYLWHALVALVFLRFQVHWFTFPLYPGISIALGIVMSKLVEFPSLTVRERFFPMAYNRDTTAHPKRGLANPVSRL